jgi:DnaJ-class molecular chaperone
VYTIDKRQVTVSHPGPTGPDFSQTFPGLGMPKPHDPKIRGDFIVHVTINFPLFLTVRQKQILCRAIPMPSVIEIMNGENIIEKEEYDYLSSFD